MLQIILYIFAAIIGFFLFLFFQWMSHSLASFYTKRFLLQAIPLTIIMMKKWQYTLLQAAVRGVIFAVLINVIGIFLVVLFTKDENSDKMNINDEMLFSAITTAEVLYLLYLYNIL